ncbi:hypothetical protein GCM10012275_31180 [Longimycelium tulufanense]|uniref:Secreted protein n=1 Tax=Longimycelium tulufanense TaxID=907463 RepID=A0A8J3FX05_9PSEU|nr:hypothetical protein [Longimycelium tulufanense]GGM57726.1 hypothetical protein GCM10012275_31180 [Longimycelium tulufanense]
MRKPLGLAAGVLAAGTLLAAVVVPSAAAEETNPSAPAAESSTNAPAKQKPGTDKDKPADQAEQSKPAEQNDADKSKDPKPADPTDSDKPKEPKPSNPGGTDSSSGPSRPGDEGPGMDGVFLVASPDGSFVFVGATCAAGKPEVSSPVLDIQPLRQNDENRRMWEAVAKPSGNGDITVTAKCGGKNYTTTLARADIAKAKKAGTSVKSGQPQAKNQVKFVPKGGVETGFGGTAQI